MKKYYQFDELKDRAFSLFEVLLDKREIQLTSHAPLGDGVALTAPQIQSQVDALRKQAWGLAEAFLDYGQTYHEKFYNEVDLTSKSGITATMERQLTDAADEPDEPVEPVRPGRPKVRAR